MTLPCDTDIQIHDYRHYIQELVLQLTGKHVAKLPFVAKILNSDILL